MKLEIGAGRRGTEGYVHLDVFPSSDIDVVWDAVKTPYPFSDCMFEEIFSHWFLEHVSFRDIDYVLMEWIRILIDGGKVKAVTNNYEAHNQALMEGIINWEEWNRMIFGIKDKSDESWKNAVLHNYPVSLYDCHKFGWCKEYAIKKFSSLGFKSIEISAATKHREDNGDIKCPGLIIEATK